MSNFEDLKIWQESHRLMQEIHELCRLIPVDEKFRLRAQIERSSSSVADNIASGHSAYYYNEKIKDMYTARKEAGETQNHLRSIQAKGYADKRQMDEKINRYQIVIKGINGYVKYIVNKRDNKKKEIGKLGNQGIGLKRSPSIPIP